MVDGSKVKSGGNVKPSLYGCPVNSGGNVKIVYGPSVYCPVNSGGKVWPGSNVKPYGVLTSESYS